MTRLPFRPRKSCLTTRKHRGPPGITSSLHARLQHAKIHDGPRTAVIAKPAKPRKIVVLPKTRQRASQKLPKVTRDLIRATKEAGDIRKPRADSSESPQALARRNAYVQPVFDAVTEVMHEYAGDALMKKYVQHLHSLFCATDAATPTDAVTREESFSAGDARAILVDLARVANSKQTSQSAVACMLRVLLSPENEHFGKFNKAGLNGTQYIAMDRSLAKAVRGMFGFERLDDGSCITDVSRIMTFMYYALGARDSAKAFTLCGDGRNHAGRHTTVMSIRYDDHLVPVAILNHKEDYGKLKGNLDKMLQDMAKIGRDGLTPVPIADLLESFDSDLLSTLVKTCSLMSNLYAAKDIQDPVPVTWQLAADMKFLLLITGMNAAHSDRACLFCTCNKVQRAARTSCPKRQATAMGDGRILPNLVPFIPTDRIIPDTLHLLLRVGEHIAIGLFVRSGVEKEVFNSALQRVLPKFELQPGEGSMKWKLPTITGTEERRLYEKAHEWVPPLFVGNETLGQRALEAVTEFWQLYLIVNSRVPLRAEEVQSLRARLDAWITLCLSPLASNTGLGRRAVAASAPLFRQEFVVPYVHLFISHLPDILAEYGTLRDGNMQALELSNSKHHGLSYISQRGQSNMCEQILALDLKGCVLHTSKPYACEDCGSDYLYEAKLKSHVCVPRACASAS